MPKKDMGKITGEPVTTPIPSPAGGVRLETFIPWTLVKRGVHRQIITPLDAPQEFLPEAAREREQRQAAQDSALVRALGLAHYWQSLLDAGRFASLGQIAAAEQLDLGQVSRIARLAQLAPDLVDRCLAGQGKGLALEHLMRGKLPPGWAAQRLQLPPGR